ncbi:MAG: alpha-glucan family phosphorylase, partial [Bacteroidales bacterium]|nr:alpha-glucan family phosphorylase [Bacteroidales bacterium]
MNNMEKFTRPDYLFEVSWEVCNKVGGIHTVIATKALNMNQDYGRTHILIGPDVWVNNETNPEFEEDENLYRNWKNQTAGEGFRVRIGRWNVPGNPVVILVDFSQFISKKNEIFSLLWDKFGLDSLSGQWDYIEPALFGYASGKVIESFTKYNLQPYNKVVAQFHEWMTGAGVLYIKSRSLRIGTVFTSHATVVGRCLASNNIPLYDSMNMFDGDQKAKEFNVTAKHSLEKCAARQSDVFTTVSKITALECKQFLDRDVDIITPNGFENSITPSESEYAGKRAAARSKLLSVASLMHNTEYDVNTVIIGISGRYEYKNKGIDVFLDAVDKIRCSSYSGKKILAFIMIPAGNNGPDKELLAKVGGNGSKDYTTYMTHYLSDPEYDTVSNRIKAFDPKASSDNINVVYVPSYLNGNDGVFDMSYYDLLAGIDLTVFPSYYEPWGYTPLESLAFGVPTITTTLAGFGLWVNEFYKKPHPSIEVVERNDANYDMVVDAVINKIVEVAGLNSVQRTQYAENARSVSKIALWKNNIRFYSDAYVMAMNRVVSQKGPYPQLAAEKEQVFTPYMISKPAWHDLQISKALPVNLKNLDELSHNLWWCWNDCAVDLFKLAGRDLWYASGRNPIVMLDMIDLPRYKELSEDEEFVARLKEVYEEFSEYMSAKKERKSPRISYFCMEYGLDTSLKIYSGGLGILAGDYLKEASDMNVDMNAVGLLYKYGYFTQKISSSGDQIAVYDPQNFSKTPAYPLLDKDGNWITVSVAFPGRLIYAHVWKVDVGRVELYLMDSDIDKNLPEDRGVTGELYGGDWENRLKQELLLGVGGIRLLRKIGIHSDIYHCNEGHGAFVGLERLREYIMNDNLSYAEGIEAVRSSALFTTHTPVPAGHDAFSEDLLRTYIGHYPQRLKVDWKTMMSLGKTNVDDPNEKFSMSFLAANLSQEVNGVSWLHGKVSREIFARLWPGYLPEELPLGYVTNGVHYPTWTAPEWKKIHAGVFGGDFATHHYDKRCFGGIREVSASKIWETRNLLRKRLIDYVKRNLSDPSVSSHYSPQEIVQIKSTLRDDILTIGFARRFATYKRASLLFRNLDRLAQIVNDPKTPVQFLFAGKAHPADKGGQNLIKKIVEISRMPQFIGKIVFVPNYDITLAKYLVQGVDIWMNTPTRPLEASGTSGEKAVMNGVMHFSVLDGWWVEGYREGAGWALPMERTYENQDYQDELDAATIYNILETDILPKYYDKDKNGISGVWIDIIKNCVAQV